jgi:hypothetical protein
LVSFELIDNIGLQPLFKTGTLLSFFDTNTRNHQKSPTYLSDLEQFLPDCVKQTDWWLGVLVSRFLLLYPDNNYSESKSNTLFVK